MKPSEIIGLVAAALDAAFPDAVEVEARIVARRTNRWRSPSGQIYRFVNLDLVDKDAEGQTVVLGATTTVRDLERMLGHSGLEIDAVTAEGALIIAAGQIEAVKNTGAPQLKISSIAPAGLSDDMLARHRTAQRIKRERLGDLRHDVLEDVRIVRRAVVIGTRTGFQDVQSGFHAARYLPPPAACYHEINPRSVTTIVDVPRLIAAHVDAGVDAVLLAFGGHLPVPNPWDAEPIIDAIVAAHRSGVAVLAGFAHAQDRPLTKDVAFDLKQASAAARRLVERNDQRVQPLLALSGCVPTIRARHDDRRMRSQNTVRRIADQTRRQHTQTRRAVERTGPAINAAVNTKLTDRHQRLARISGAATQSAARLHQTRDQLARIVRTVAQTDGRLERAQDQLTRAGRTIPATATRRRSQDRARLTTAATAVTSRLAREHRERLAVTQRLGQRISATASARITAAATRFGRQARNATSLLTVRIRRSLSELRATSLFSQMLHNGWALVANSSGGPAPSPTPGDRIVVRTIASQYEATVDRIEDTDG